MKCNFGVSVPGFITSGAPFLRQRADLVAASIGEISKEIAELSRDPQLALLGLLVGLERSGTGDEDDSAWDEEIRARIGAVDESRTVGIPYEQIKREMADWLV